MIDAKSVMTLCHTSTPYINKNAYKFGPLMIRINEIVIASLDILIYAVFNYNFGAKKVKSL